MNWNVAKRTLCNLFGTDLHKDEIENAQEQCMRQNEAALELSVYSDSDWAGDIHAEQTC